MASEGGNVTSSTAGPSENTASPANEALSLMYHVTYTGAAALTGWHESDVILTALRHRDVQRNTPAVNGRRCSSSPDFPDALAKFLMWRWGVQRIPRTSHPLWSAAAFPAGPGLLTAQCVQLG